MALEAGNDDMAVALILEFNLPYAQAGWIVTVFDWLNAFGRDRVAEQPELSMLLAWAFLNLRRYDEVEQVLAASSLAEPTQTSTYGPIHQAAGRPRLLRERRSSARNKPKPCLNHPATPVR